MGVDSTAIWGTIIAQLTVIVVALLKLAFGKQRGCGEHDPMIGDHLRAIRLWVERTGTEAYRKIEELVTISRDQLVVQEQMRDYNREDRKEQARILNGILNKL